MHDGGGGGGLGVITGRNVATNGIGAQDMARKLGLSDAVVQSVEVMVRAFRDQKLAALRRHHADSRLPRPIDLVLFARRYQKAVAEFLDTAHEWDGCLPNVTGNTVGSSDTRDGLITNLDAYIQKVALEQEGGDNPLRIHIPNPYNTPNHYRALVKRPFANTSQVAFS